MHTDELRRLLKRFGRKEISTEEVLRRLRTLPFEDLGFAKVDHHRHLRKGFPEVIFGEGKTTRQIISIMGRIASRRQPVLVTRVSEATYRKIRSRYRKACYHVEARAVTLDAPKKGRPRPGILVVAAGTSDLNVAEEAAVTAEAMGNGVERVYDVGIAGLHRLLDHRDNLLKANVIVTVAGMEGALPSIVSSLVDVPVIGVPTSIGYGTGLGGVAALMSMLNSCASGLVVVNIDNGFGAGYAASVINRHYKN